MLAWGADGGDARRKKHGAFSIIELQPVNVVAGRCGHIIPGVDGENTVGRQRLGRQQNEVRAVGRAAVDIEVLHFVLIARAPHDFDERGANRHAETDERLGGGRHKTKIYDGRGL